MVIKKVTWPHEVVYAAICQPSVYGELSVTLFVTRYLAVMESVKPALTPIMTEHPKELMADVKVYGWSRVRAYHAVWLQ